MRKLIFLLVLSTFSLLWGCARAQPAADVPPPPTPTKIVYPATWTPQPSATPLLPTPTHTPNADTVQVLKAFARSGGLTVYHAQMDMFVTDPSGSIPGAEPGKPFALMSMEGRTNPDAQQFVLKGFILSFLGSDPEQGIEFIMFGDKVYLHGPFPYFGANENRWYVSPRPSSAGLTDTANPKAMLGDFGGGNLPTMRAAETSTFDEKKCTLYRGDEQEAIDYFVNLDPQGNLKSTLGRYSGQIDKGILDVTVCEDGYVYRMDLGLQFRTTTKPAQTGSLDVTLRFNDMNIIVPIQEPKDAIPLPKPLMFPTPYNPTPFAMPTPYRFPTVYVSPTFPTF